MATDQDTHDQDVTYAPMADVARAYGVSVDTIRRRLRKGELQGRKEQTPSGFKWLVEMPAPGETLPGSPLVPAAATDPGAMIDTLQRELAARNDEIARLTGLLESQARALESALQRPALPDPAESGAVGSPVSNETDATHISTPDKPSSAWGRFVRWLQGE